MIIFKIILIIVFYQKKRQLLKVAEVGLASRAKLSIKNLVLYAKYICKLNLQMNNGAIYKLSAFKFVICI